MSGTEFLLDTNMVIGLLKGHPPALLLAEQAGLALARTTVSQITRMELLGFAKLSTEEESAIRSLLAACQVQLLTEAIETQAIRLRRTGAFKLPDAIVAATALVGQCRLLTLDQGMLTALTRVQAGL